MTLLREIRQWLRRVFRSRSKSRFSRPEHWAEMLEGLILRQGREVSDDNLASARGLRLNVEALFAEHDRLKAASWQIEFILDLADLRPDDADLVEQLSKLDVPNHEIETQGRQLSVSLCHLNKLIDLPNCRMSVTEVITLGVVGIHQRLAEVPDQFPANRYPNGASDWQLESLRWSEAEQRFHLSGWWKPEVRERLPAKLFPETSIELRRSRFSSKKLVSARPIPELKNIKSPDWLKAWTRESLFENETSTVPATDLRASLQSGPTGPAPLPKELQWPNCPGCGEAALFSQSVDVRDIDFSVLLPGTTMVIFVCNECHIAGEWHNCAAVIWLGWDEEVVMQDRGSPAPLLQQGQWHGAELMDLQELPQHVARELELAGETGGDPCYLSCYGTKVGGFPAYLQQEELFYDRNGPVMEYIAQIATPGHISAGGFGYVYFSTGTQETYIEFQDT